VRFAHGIETKPLISPPLGGQSLLAATGPAAQGKARRQAPSIRSRPPMRMEFKSEGRIDARSQG